MVNRERPAAPLLYSGNPEAMYLLYSLALCAYLLAHLPVVAYRVVRHRKAVGRLRDRVGRLPAGVNPGRRRSIWIHAVSVGEVLAARSLVAELRDAYPRHRLLMSTTTATGQHVARQSGRAVDAVFYAPLDMARFVARALDRVAPDMLVLIDTEIWPNLLRACRRRGVKTVLVNGRLSDRSYRRYRLVRPFMRRVLGGLDHLCVQNRAWRRRFRDLGVPPARLTVTGSLKFDAVDGAAARAPAGDPALRCFEFAAGRPVIIAASTLRGEEEPVLRAFAGARRSAAAGAVLIIAPRHPERFAEATRLAAGRGFAVARRTELGAAPGTAAAPPADVVILDTIGELARLFRLATVVFVGGSLVPAGGHNPIEPAAFGKAIVFGPHMENFADIANLFVARGAAWQLAAPDQLDGALAALLSNAGRRAALGAAARALVDDQRGARGRTLAVIAELLRPDGAPTEARAADTPC